MIAQLVDGILWDIAVVVFVLGIIWRLIAVFRHGTRKDLAEPRGVYKQPCPLGLKYRAVAAAATAQYAEPHAHVFVIPDAGLRAGGNLLRPFF